MDYIATPALTNSSSPTSSLSPSLGPNRTKSLRTSCSDCGHTFGRITDMLRHKKKHQPEMSFKCPVTDCTYKGNYRKDKRDAHVKKRHLAVAAASV